MLKALAIKELRDVLGIAAVALAVYLLLVSGLIGLPPLAGIVRGARYEVPLAGPSFEKLFGLLSAIFALALGFRQSAWEGVRGTFPFLLHRPIRRETIFLTKLAVGIGVFLVGFGLPVLLYAWWAAVPGHHASPFAWGMLEPAGRIALAMPLVYLAAFLSGLRPARWWGTRLLPLAAPIVPVMLLLIMPWNWVAGVTIAVIPYALLLSAICYVGRSRDYP